MAAAWIYTGLMVEPIQHVGALDNFGDKWNGLLERNETKVAEPTDEWQMTYWNHFKENSELLILVVKESVRFLWLRP